MLKNGIIVVVILVMVSGGFSSASASPAARIVGGVVTNVASTIFKRLWSLKSPTKAAIPSRSMMKFESGYNVDTVFDGSKLGIEPHSVEVSANGDILVLDSENSNIYMVSSPLSRYSRPKLLAGSGESFTGHVDGKLRDARMNHPKGLAIDDGGNIYIADTMNMAIRKISDSGVVTIAGGKLGRGGAHIDGPSEDAKFSNDFDLVYVASTCSLLVIDRGNRAIREIQLQKEDCSYQNDNNLPLGIAVLAGACFFGYMLALLQRRISTVFSYDDNREPKTYAKNNMPPAPYNRPPSKSVRPPLIPPEEDEYENQQEGLFSSLGRLIMYTSSSFFEIFGGLFSGFRHRKAPHHHRDSFRHVKSGWPVQESFVIPSEDDPPPSLETRDPTPRKSYHPITSSKDLDKARHYKQGRGYYNSGWNNGDHHHHHHQQQSQRQVQQQQYLQQQYQQHHEKHHPSSAETCYEAQDCETNEIVFGAVQEGSRREAVVIKAVDYGDQVICSDQNVRSRYNYMSYSSSYGY